MIDGRWKYIHYRGLSKYPKHMPKLENALYDLQTDPRETANLASAQPEIAKKMLTVIEEQLQIHGNRIQ